MLLDKMILDFVFNFILFPIIFFVSVHNMFNHYKSIHDPLKNVFYLSLPVSTLERYFFVLLKFLFLLPLFLLICCYLSFNIVVFLDQNLIMESKMHYYIPFDVSLLFIKNTYLVYLFGFSIFLFSRIMFKSHPFFKSVIIVSLYFILLGILFNFIIFFVDNYLFKVMSGFYNWVESYFFKYIGISFAGFIYFYLYFVLRNLGNLNTRKIGFTILMGLTSFFVVFVFCFLTFLVLYAIYASYVLHA
ncbi:ABC transporter permease [Borrelia persica]|uniref:ABC transporter permease n=1 Tax=Borrelia persica TaxID=44448 RepID=UPI001F1F8625|nr:ABC transporter permease [Borrelia persica]